MTAKHILEGVMQMTRARDFSHCAVILGVQPSVITRLNNGTQKGLYILTLDLIQQKSGIPFDMIFAWYRLPEGAHLGRVTKTGRTEWRAAMAQQQR